MGRLDTFLPRRYFTFHKVVCPSMNTTLPKTEGFLLMPVGVAGVKGCFRVNLRGSASSWTAPVLWRF